MIYDFNLVWKWHVQIFFYQQDEDFIWNDQTPLFCLDENKKFACFLIKIKFFYKGSFLILEEIKVYKVKGKKRISPDGCLS